MLELARLCIYPVKSLRGFDVDSAELRERGLQHDRAWVVVGPDGEALTQRTWPRMALVRTSVENAPEGVVLTLAAEGRDALRVPARSSKRRVAIVWGDTVDAADCGAEASRWLSEFLGTACALVRMDARSQRITHPDGGAGRAVRFADELPLLVISEETVRDVAERVPGEVTVQRFRPNLVVRGAEPYAEDRWRRLRIGDVEIEIVKPTSRCVLVNVDPESGEPDPHGQPLRTLATYRRTTEAAYEHERNQVYLGVRAVVVRTGVVRVGDAVALSVAADSHAQLETLGQSVSDRGGGGEEDAL